MENIKSLTEKAFKRDLSDQIKERLNMQETEYVSLCVNQYFIEIKKHELQAEKLGLERTATSICSASVDCHNRMILDIGHYAKDGEEFVKMRDEFERLICEINSTQMVNQSDATCK